MTNNRLAPIRRAATRAGFFASWRLYAKLSILLWTFTLALFAADVTDKGVLKILASGQQIGTERFEIAATDDGYRASGELKLKMPNGQDANETSVMTLDKNLALTSYTRDQRSPRKAGIKAEFNQGRATAHYDTPEGKNTMEFFMEPGVVVLDTNFFHHFFLLLQRYQADKTKAQNVNVFIPQEATPGMLLLEWLGKEGASDKWRAKTEVEILIWSDGNGHLVKLAVPAAKVEVVREEPKK